MDRSIMGANSIQTTTPRGDGEVSPQQVNTPANAAQGLAQGVRGLPNLLAALPVELLGNINSYLDPVSERAMSQTSQSARKLFLQNITSLKISAAMLEQAFRLFPNAYPNVHTFQITDTPTMQQIQHLVASPRESVQHLDLSRCEELPDDVFVSLLNCFPDLMSLDLSGSSGVTGDADIEQVGTFPNLVFLNLRNCRELSGDALTPIAGRFPCLVSLNLSNCSGVSDQALADASARLPSMAYLNLSGCLQLTDAGVAALSVNCPNLMSLSLSGCNQLTDAAIMTLADNCPYLAFLTLGECDQISDQVLTVLARNCPYLNAVSLNDRLFNRFELQSRVQDLIE